MRVLLFWEVFGVFAKASRVDVETYGVETLSLLACGEVSSNFCLKVVGSEVLRICFFVPGFNHRFSFNKATRTDHLCGSENHRVSTVQSYSYIACMVIAPYK